MKSNKEWTNKSANINGRWVNYDLMDKNRNAFDEKSHYVRFIYLGSSSEVRRDSKSPVNTFDEVFHFFRRERIKAL